MCWVRSWVTLVRFLVQEGALMVQQSVAPSFWCQGRRCIFQLCDCCVSVRPFISTACFLLFTFSRDASPSKSSSWLRTATLFRLILWSYTLKHLPFDSFVAKSIWSQSCSEISPSPREALSSCFGMFLQGCSATTRNLASLSSFCVVFTCLSAPVWALEMGLQVL